MKVPRGRVRLWLLSLWLLSATARAQSEPHVILLLTRDQSLTRALHVALSSWGLTIRAYEPPAQAMSSEAAAQRAREWGAGAIVWLDPSTEPPQLAIYVDKQARLYVQALRDRAPFDDEAAAAIALSVKTVLRNSTLAPETERVTEAPDAGLAPAPPAAAATPPAPSPAAPTTVPPLAAGLAASRAAAPTLPLLRIEAAVGLRSAPSTHVSPRPLYGASLALFEPWWSRRRLGLSLGAMLTQPSSFRTSQAQGELREWRLALGARGLVPLARFLNLELGANFELEGTRIHGHDPLQRGFTASRINSALGFSIALDFQLPKRLWLAPRFGLHRVLEPQRYFIGDELLLALRDVALEGSLRLGVGFL